MLDLSILEPKEGQIFPRPAWLSFPEGIEPGDAGAVSEQILRSGKAMVYGGVNVVGEKGYFVTCVGIMATDMETSANGWYVCANRPEDPEPDFTYYDQANPAAYDFMPHVIVYFVGAADTKYAAQDVSRDDLIAKAQFVGQFITDSGPPDEVDWPVEA